MEDKYFTCPECGEFECECDDDEIPTQDNIDELND